MKHVANAATDLGIDHQYIPPHQQSLNEAEKIADSIWGEARAVSLHHNAPDNWFSLMVDMAMYTDIRTSTTASRDWKTPFEMTRGIQPTIDKIHRPCTKCFVNVPKTKRAQLAKRGMQNIRAEPGRLVGFHGPYSSTYAVILEPQYKGQQERLVHSINVTFDDTDFVIGRAPADKAAPRPDTQFDRFLHHSFKEANNGTNDNHLHPQTPEQSQNPLYDMQNMRIQQMQPFVSIPPLPTMPTQNTTDGQNEYFDLEDPNNQPWFTHDGTPQARDRPSYHHMCTVMKEKAMCNMVMTKQNKTDPSLHVETMRILTTAIPQHEVFTRMAHILAVHAQKDMDWKTTLQGPDRDKAINALEAEISSLLSTILTEVSESDEEYQIALELATPGRLLLSIKRDESFKARGVKQGFKEDTEQADGPNFNYYAHVAKFNSIRMSIFRMNRGTRRIAIKDVSTAFLQSNKYPEGTVKYVSFKCPLQNIWKYYRQSGPLYGEKSASKRWEDTIAPWYESIGYERGQNEPCAFLNTINDTLVLLWTDDNFIDAEEDEITLIAEQLNTRFDCKGLEILSPGIELDYIGMQLFQTQKHTALCLETYIHKTLEILGLNNSTTTAHTPICKPIDGTSNILTGEHVRLFPTAVGSFGWMANTCRPDIAYAHSRLAQHLAKPTESAWQAVVHLCNYLRGTADLCIAAPMHQKDRDPTKPIITDDSYGWEFFCDSDFAGNCEEQNNRRSQSGYIAILNGAPVLWGSKVSSVCFAHPDIGEAHADISSGAAEVYAAGNATFEFLHLSYTADEMGIPFPQPFTMQIDNKAAIAFSDNSAFKSKLKHIDVRQKWVQTLRNKSIINTVHVPSEENNADMFTKILGVELFTKFRDKIMFKRSSI